MTYDPVSLKRYVEYISKTQSQPLPIEAFDDDWAPIGYEIRQELEQHGLVNDQHHYAGELVLTPAGVALSEAPISPS